MTHIAFAISVILIASVSLAEPELEGASACTLSLLDVLHQLDSNGFNIIYSHKLVKPWMQVPSLSAPANIQALRKLLKLYGLTTAAGPKKSLLIVRDAQADTVDTLIVGRVVIDDSGQPVRGGRVSIDGQDRRWSINKEGCFLLPGITAGEYTLSILADETYKNNQQAIVIKSNGYQQIDVRVQRAPFSSVLMLDEQIIVGSHFSISDTPVGNAVAMDKEEIAQIVSASRGVSTVVAHLPGVVSGSLISTFNLRGGRVSEVRTVIDGVEMLNPYLVTDLSGGLFSSIDREVVDSVTLHSGAYGAEYGNAMSGILNVNTDIDEGAGSKYKLGRQLWGYESYYVKAKGSFASDKGEYLFFGTAGELGGYVGGFEEAEQPEFNEWFAKLNYYLDDYTKLSLSTIRDKDKSKFVTTVFTPSPLFEGEAESQYDWLKVTRNWSRYATSEFTLSHGMDNRFRLVSFDGADNTIFENELLVAGIIGDRPYPIDFSSRSSYTSIQANTYIELAENTLLKFGARWRDLEAIYDYNASFFFTPLAIDDRPTRRDVLESTKVDRQGKDYNMYLSLQAQLQQRWLLEAGLRWDAQTYVSQGENDQFSPRINLVYDIAPNTHLNLGWGRFYQAQGIHQLNIEQGQNDFHEAEVAEHLVAGVDQQMSKTFSWRVDFYRKNYEQLATRWENQPSSLVGLLPEADIPINASSAIVHGVELSLHHATSDSLSWFLNYSYSTSKDRVAGKFQPRPWDQNHTANFGFSYSWRRWHFNGGASYYSGRPFRTIYENEFADDNNQPVLLSVISKDQYNRAHAEHSYEYSIARTWNLTDEIEFELGIKVQRAENFDASSLNLELAF